MAAVLAVAGLLTAGCQKGSNVGSKFKNFNEKDKAAAAALRDALKSPAPSTAPTANSNAIGNSPKPVQSTQGATQNVLEIDLTHDSPYYSKGQDMEVTAGTLIKIKNTDDKDRRFFTQDGPYDTADMPPGTTRQFTANIKGKWALQDPNVPFATGSLTVN
ncbi:MAG: hypothetical protein LC723_06310 [Actinobacteria bacterium]|nr:hypothetical protein [Actinomycetota bacterium]